jgi:hypothetical protein
MSLQLHWTVQTTLEAYLNEMKQSNLDLSNNVTNTSENLNDQKSDSVLLEDTDIIPLDISLLQCM